MMNCIAILSLLAAAPVEAFMTVVSPTPYNYAARTQVSIESSSSSFALAATPKDITMQTWAASAALMTVMSFSQIASATVQPTEMTLQRHEQQYPSTLVAAGAYQPESGYATLDLGFPKYTVEDGPAYKGPQGEPGGILRSSADTDDEQDLSTLDPKQAAKLEAKRQEAAQRAKVEQEKQIAKLKALAAKQQAKEAALNVELAACESGNLDNLDLSPNEKSKLIKKCNAAAVRKQKEQQQVAKVNEY